MNGFYAPFYKRQKVKESDFEYGIATFKEMKSEKDIFLEKAKRGEQVGFDFINNKTYTPE